jgi:hypothetical protein
MALVALTCFVLNLQVVGEIFNIAATENALLAWVCSEFCSPIDTACALSSS